MQIFSLLVSFTEKCLRYLLIVLMALLVLDVLWQVITRFILSNPSSFTEELSRFLLIWIGLLGAALAYKDSMHLGLDILTKDLTGKKKLYSDLLVHVLVAIFAIVVLIVGGGNLVGLTLSLNQVSASMGILMGYVYVALPLSGALILLYSMDFVVRDIQAYASGQHTAVSE